MRELTGHRVNPANDALKIQVRDEPGSAGANYCYAVTGFDFANNPSVPSHTQASHLRDEDTAFVIFQNGPITEVGINGLTHEVLIAILIDRLQGFQHGPFANHCNARALRHLEEAQSALLERTRERMARGVEGTHGK